MSEHRELAGPAVNSGSAKPRFAEHTRRVERTGEILASASASPQVLGGRDSAR